MNIQALIDMMNIQALIDMMNIQALIDMMNAIIVWVVCPSAKISTYLMMVIVYVCMVMVLNKMKSKQPSKCLIYNSSTSNT
jgi:hypothetical protein